jgi:EAL domain-containing protein (putative c-di-GMP-specific phosphodiesterase class I)
MMIHRLSTWLGTRGGVALRGRSGARVVHGLLAATTFTCQIGVFASSPRLNGAPLLFLGVAFLCFLLFVALTLIPSLDAKDRMVRVTDLAAENADTVLAGALRDAIDKHALSLVYQPIVDASGKTMVGVEALCRWRDSAHGEISPDRFIALAEETGLIVPLGAWALREACRAAFAWPGLKLAVNVSPRQFREVDFVALVEGVLSETGMEPTRLELELTENLFVRDIDDARRKMEALKARGVGLALDDFGTGYSSLSYLLSLPFDKIKIDRSFVLKIESGASGAAIVHSIVSLGRALGMQMTAEGVDTPQQHQFLRIAGVNSFQGYYFGRPVDSGAIAARMASGLEDNPAASAATH